MNMTAPNNISNAEGSWNLRSARTVSLGTFQKEVSVLNR
jgi:hypothetical protein